MAGREYDVVIAGAGAGGGFAAMALTRAGLDVLLLERGRRFDFTKDFPLRHRDWERYADVLAATSREDDTIVRRPGPPIEPRDLDIGTRGYALLGGGAERYTRRQAFHYARVYGVGGSTLHYQGEAHRFPAHAFKPRSLFGWGRDWPIGYDDLAPYYHEAERVLGVAGDPANRFKPARGPFPTPAHALTTRSQLVRQGATKLGWSLLPNSLALPSRSLDGRSPCRHSGGCELGCPFGAKSSTDLTAISRAESTGRLTLIDDARLVRVETDAQGRVSGFVYRHGKALERARGRRYVLALGAVETPRMLLSSESPAHPHGIGNADGLVGRYFMETVFVMVQVEAPFPVSSYQGPPLDARIWDFSRPRPGSAVATGYTLGPRGGLLDNGPVGYAKSIRGFGIDHKNRMRAGYGRQFFLTGVTEHETRYDNYVALSGEERDAEGVPKVVVHSDYSRLDKAALREMLSHCRALIDAAGLRATDRRWSSYTHPTATHVAGGCIMGDDPRSAVTDAYGKVHGAGNLYVTDASVLPSQGAGDSPSLTIQALALRAARRISQS